MPPPVEVGPHHAARGAVVNRRFVDGIERPVCHVPADAVMSPAEVARMLDRGLEAEPALDPVRTRWRGEQRRAGA
jgi:hypothetical protein